MKKFNSSWIERNVYLRPKPGVPEQEHHYEQFSRPVIVCLCGSTKFMEAWQAANLSETLAGKIVLSIGCNTKSDADLQRLGQLTPEKKAELDELHKRKIDLADEVLVLNVGGYVGDSTRSEIEYAKRHHKPIRWLEPESAS
jgi:cell division protein FtsB